MVTLYSYFFFFLSFFFIQHRYPIVKLVLEEVLGNLSKVCFFNIVSRQVKSLDLLGRSQYFIRMGEYSLRALLVKTGEWNGIWGLEMRCFQRLCY